MSDKPTKPSRSRVSRISAFRERYQGLKDKLEKVTKERDLHREAIKIAQKQLKHLQDAHVVQSVQRDIERESDLKALVDRYKRLLDALATVKTFMDGSA